MWLTVCVSGGGAADVDSPSKQEKNSKPEKCYWGGANPHRPLHALLGCPMPLTYFFFLHTPIKHPSQSKPH